jgi:hypothetical protein
MFFWLTFAAAVATTVVGYHQYTEEQRARTILVRVSEIMGERAASGDRHLQRDEMIDLCWEYRHLDVWFDVTINYKYHAALPE